MGTKKQSAWSKVVKITLGIATIYVGIAVLNTNPNNEDKILGIIISAIGFFVLILGIDGSDYKTPRKNENTQ